jgi:NADH:ubiquinone reductase (H+-translocating)
MKHRGSSSGKPGVLIVGAGFGGLAVARKLERAPIKVTVIDRRNYTLFQPLLYQVATAALAPSDVAVPIRSLLRAPNTEVLLDEVVGVDQARSRVRTASGLELPYRFLVLASGSEPNYFGHHDWSVLAPSPKALEDAVAIRERVLGAFELAESACEEVDRQSLMTLVVVGGGATGVEMAGALAELTKTSLARDFRRIRPADARILLVEGGPSLLAGFPDRLRSYA